MLHESTLDMEHSAHAPGIEPDFADFINAQLDAQPFTDGDVDRMWAQEQERTGGDFAATLDGCLRRVALGQLNRMK